VPIYTYYCPSCDKVSDVLHKVFPKGSHACLECGCSTERLPTVPSGFVFKGSGFYATDYKKGEKND